MVDQIHREGRTQEVEVVAHQPELIDELHLVAPVVDKSLVEKERVRRVTQKKVTRAHRGDISGRLLETVREALHFDQRTLHVVPAVSHITLFMTPGNRACVLNSLVLDLSASSPSHAGLQIRLVRREILLASIPSKPTKEGTILHIALEWYNSSEFSSETGRRWER